MASLVTGLARPGSRFVLDAWVGDRHELPRISFIDPSRMSPAPAPGEMEKLSGEAWRIERLPRPGNRFIANFLLTKR